MALFTTTKGNASMNEQPVKSLASQRLTIAVERQRYMSDMAKDTFNYFTKLFASMAAGAFAVVSLREKLDMHPATLDIIFSGITILIGVVGILSILQILFCLWRWFQYRTIEYNLTNDPAVRPSGSAAFFELAYCAAILILVGAACFARPTFTDIANAPTVAAPKSKS